MASRPKVLSPVFTIPKPNQPGEYRVCFDLRFISSHLFVPMFKLDSVSSTLQAVTPRAFFYKTDLRSGFHHLHLSEGLRGGNLFPPIPPDAVGVGNPSGQTPATQVVFLGFVIDSETMTLSLPNIDATTNILLL